MSGPERDTTQTAGDRGVESALPFELAAGARMGRYVIGQRRGAGGMGVVYAAWDSELARNVALKVVRPRVDVATMQARLRREAKAMARLSHANVVPVFDIGSDDGTLFIAMELVEGETLRSWIERRRPWRDVIRLFVKAGRGLEAAHAAGLLHRDFKPDNVIVGRGDEPRITDFGLARELGEPAAPSTAPAETRELAQVTATGAIAGTPAYMAPEQQQHGGQRVGPAADQFSFCVALFEAVHGARPFQVPTRGDVRTERHAGRIVKPAASRGVPAWVHAAIVRGLAADPAARWPSMRALIDALERGLRRRRLARTGVLAALAIGGAVGVGTWVGVPGTTPSCLEVAQHGNDAATITVCTDAYARRGDPDVGSELADALRRTGNLREAATIANALLTTRVRADALYTLGKVAADEDRREDAARALRLAGDLHREQQRWGRAAEDSLARAEVLDDVVDQLVVLDQAMTFARRGVDPRTEALSHVAAGCRRSVPPAARGRSWRARSGS